MKDYSTNFDRNKITNFLIILSIVISVIINIVIYNPFIKPLLDFFEMKLPDLHFLLNTVDWIFLPVAYVTVYNFIWSNYRDSIWKKRKILFVKLNNVPDISGEWNGWLKSSRISDNGKQDEFIERKLQMVIVQNFTQMKITCNFCDAEGQLGNSSSESQVIGFYHDKASWKLKFSFKNHSNEIDTTAIDYFGYNEFIIDPITEKMSGWYFTGRDSGQNRGNMVLERSE